MVKAGLITRKEGYCPVSEFDGNLKEASRFKPTAKLIALWESYEIDPSEWNRHFEAMTRPGAIARPIALKTAKRKKAHPKSGKPIEIPSERMKFDPAHPLAKAAGEHVNAINDFLAGQDIQPSHAFYAFERIYSLGDDPSFNWNKGGRLYALEGGYQQWPLKPRKEEPHHRGGITINGEPVVEVDIRASHLTILHALKGVPMGNADPYCGTAYPRFVVKSYVAMTLGHDKRPGNQWSKTAKVAYASKECEVRKRDNAGETHCTEICKGKCLQKLFPMSKVGPEIAKHFPILDDWKTSPWRWADLQFIESQAVIGAVHELCVVHNVPALPVHDSILVPASQKELAKEVLSRMFEKHVGVSPVLKVSAEA